MNKLLISLAFILYILVACNGASKSNETVKAIEKTDSCKSNSKNRYEVYIPERKNIDELLALLIIIDPHGKGKFALKKFKQAANHYPAIFVASNLIKNGYANYEQAIQTLIEDVHQKYPAGETVFIVGFSGGARMALGYALKHRLNGLMLCGALANASQISAIRCPIISISGMDDFNFIETAQYLFQEQLIPKNLKIELTNASHSWPDSLMLANAFGFLYLSGPSADFPSPTKSQIQLYCQQQQARIDSLIKRGDYLKAAQVERNMSTTEPFNGDGTFASSYNDLKANSKYISQFNQLKNSLKYEISVRQPYIDAFMAKDSLWWKNEITTMKNKIKTEQEPFTKNMYQRIKGFWGIACYSLSKQAITGHDADALNKILTIYRMLEPQNPDMLYFSAFPYLWKGNNKATLAMLKRALKAGFSDKGQLKKEFPESILSELH